MLRCCFIVCMQLLRVPEQMSSPQACRACVLVCPWTCADVLGRHLAACHCTFWSTTFALVIIFSNRCTIATPLYHWRSSISCRGSKNSVPLQVTSSQTSSTFKLNFKTICFLCLFLICGWKVTSGLLHYSLKILYYIGPKAYTCVFEFRRERSSIYWRGCLVNSLWLLMCRPTLCRGQYSLITPCR